MLLKKDEVRFLIVRHGESLGNAAQTLLGHTDMDLSELGYAQARETCKYILENYTVDEVRSSDLQRAWHTVEKIAAHFRVALQKERELREIMIGKWENMRISEVDERYHDDFVVWKTDFGRCCPTGGESPAMLRERISKEMWRIARENMAISENGETGRTVCIGSHGAAIRMLISEVRKTSFEDVREIPWAANASITELIYRADGTIEEVRYGYNAFMPETLAPEIAADGISKKV